jgi:SAM-dependent methyltransferase
LSHYVGVDISQHAIRRARVRAADLASLPDGERYLVGSMTDEAVQHRMADGFDIILFNECIYYLPTSILPELFSNLRSRLSSTGVYIFRLHDRERWSDHIDTIRMSLDVLEDVLSRTSKAITLVAVPTHRITSSR